MAPNEQPQFDREIVLIHAVNTFESACGPDDSAVSFRTRFARATVGLILTEPESLALLEQCLREEYDAANFFIG